jgi:hypothetical protein
VRAIWVGWTRFCVFSWFGCEVTDTPAIKVGDRVAFIVLPPWVDQLPDESQAVFRLCVGRIYPVDEIDEQGLLVLDVSADVDDLFGGYMNDIRVEPEYVERIE